MARARRTWTWVSRNEYAMTVTVWRGPVRPRWHDRLDRQGGYWELVRSSPSDSFGSRVHICAEEFKRATGLDVQPRELLKVELSVQVLSRVRAAVVVDGDGA
jgi:hypothetical protein